MIQHALNIHETSFAGETRNLSIAAWLSASVGGFLVIMAVWSWLAYTPGLGPVAGDAFASAQFGHPAVAGDAFAVSR